MNYMGSKHRIAKEIIPIMTKNIEGRTFVEPFVGGCNSIQYVKGCRRIGADNNPYLIQMWRCLQRGVAFPDKIDKETYDKYRGMFYKLGFRPDSIIPDEIIGIIGWVGYMASYAGRFYDGGYCNNKNAKRDYIDEHIRNIRGQVDRIKDVEFVTSDYQSLYIPENSVVYCDIPYKDTKQYLYSKDFDHGQFWKWAENVYSAGIEIYVSEYNAPDGWECVWEMERKNSLNRVKTYDVVERLFKHK